MSRNYRHFVFAALTVLTSALPVSAEPSCYMVTSSGRKISLAGICSNRATPTPPGNSSRPGSGTGLTQSPSQLGDYLVKEGTGGHKRGGIAEDFYYQVWSNRMNTSYTLKVWRAEDYPQGSPIVRGSFRSVGEAEEHFDCVYTSKRLRTCPNNR
ncbi:hypothetical protein OsccyDRAFT_1047 [Leptolyngbyaceae cyanobacterium JSC-12]|nr:hypothetical protein OsccyDRAFT_1047 [Leptolyngbyaceae cyanobacterium JSC-12]